MQFLTIKTNVTMSLELICYSIPLFLQKKIVLFHSEIPQKVMLNCIRV